MLGNYFQSSVYCEINSSLRGTIGTELWCWFLVSIGGCAIFFICAILDLYFRLRCWENASSNFGDNMPPRLWMFYCDDISKVVKVLEPNFWLRTLSTVVLLLLRRLAWIYTSCCFNFSWVMSVAVSWSSASSPGMKFITFGNCYSEPLSWYCCLLVFVSYSDGFNLELFLGLRVLWDW